MSKVVKKAVKSVAKVAQGVVKAVGKVAEGAVSVVKKVASSKIGKVLVTAAAVYFGGAAISGAMSSTSTAVEGIKAAWSSLSTATTQAMAGEFTQAAGSLKAGIGGQAASAVASPTSLVSPIASAPGAAVTGGGGAAISADAGSAMVNSLNAAGAGSVVPPPVPATAGGGFLSSYGGGMAIAAGSQLVGGIMQGQAQDEQAKQDAARYNANVGGALNAGGARPRGLIGSAPQVKTPQQLSQEEQARQQQMLAGGPAYLKGGLIQQARQPLMSSLSLYPIASNYGA